MNDRRRRLGRLVVRIPKRRLSELIAQAIPLVGPGKRARVEDYLFDFASDCLLVRIADASFPDTPEGAEYPAIWPSEDFDGRENGVPPKVRLFERESDREIVRDSDADGVSVLLRAGSDDGDVHSYGLALEGENGTLFEYDEAVRLRSLLFDAGFGWLGLLEVREYGPDGRGESPSGRYVVSLPSGAYVVGLDERLRPTIAAEPRALDLDELGPIVETLRECRAVYEVDFVESVELPQSETHSSSEDGVLADDCEPGGEPEQ